MIHLYYGGTFDPVHNGHVAIACAARDELGAPVQLMPAADPPHRAVPGANAQRRADMVELAIEGHQGLRTDRRELRRAGRQPERPSYTIDTVRELRDELGPDAPLALLIGADSLLGLPTWREWEALPEYVHFVVADRPGSRLDTADLAGLGQGLAARWTDAPADLRTAPAGRFYRLRQPLQPESATAIRRLIAAGQPWRHLVPAAVADYIVRHRLYFTAGATNAPV